MSLPAPPSESLKEAVLTTLTKLAQLHKILDSNSGELGDASAAMEIM